MSKRVIIGMSGGVDSSVAAALLKEQGYEVIGITLQLLAQDTERESACCNVGSICDAKQVAHRLGIPHYTINSRDVFEDKVIDHFVSQYLNGFTPNPCVECNRHIKFDELRQKAKELNADYVATGHYCRRVYDETSQTYHLKKGRDENKDQSYFLYMLTNHDLQDILFPLGDFTKAEIRQKAKDLNLINADKPESQEICFVTQKSYRNFIEERLDGKLPPHGDIIGKDGEVLGQHKGLYHYTVGQRRGLNLPSQVPLFVLKINPDNNTILVGPKDDLKQKELSLSQFSLVNEKADVIGEEFGIKLRYQMQDMWGRLLSVSGSTAIVEIPTSHSFVAGGQSCVIYDQDRVIGGGIID